MFVNWLLFWLVVAACGSSIKILWFCIVSWMPDKVLCCISSEWKFITSASRTRTNINWIYLTLCFTLWVTVLSSSGMSQGDDDASLSVFSLGDWDVKSLSCKDRSEVEGREDTHTYIHTRTHTENYALTHSFSHRLISLYVPSDWLRGQRGQGEDLRAS